VNLADTINFKRISSYDVTQKYFTVFYIVTKYMIKYLSSEKLQAKCFHWPNVPGKLLRKK
jgi:hypothetical protein